MDSYFNKPLALDSTTYNLITGFFQSRGFGVNAATTTAVALMRQAQLDGYNAIVVLDSLKGLDSVALNSIIAEILNYNRFKTSFLGNATGFTSFEPIARNIIA